MIVKFDELTKENIIEDYKTFMLALDLQAPYTDEINKLCFIWFTMGHVNSLDQNSVFNKNFNGNGANKQTH